MRSSYYKWLASGDARTARQRADQRLAARIREVHANSGGAYGSPQVTAELKETALHVNEKRGVRVIRTFSITGIRLRRRVRTTVPDPAEPQVGDLFQRDFTAAEPGQTYRGDITYLPLANGEFLCLATVLDCLIRKVVGWSIAEHNRHAVRASRAASETLMAWTATRPTARLPIRCRYIRHAAEEAMALTSVYSCGHRTSTTRTPARPRPGGRSGHRFGVMLSC
ncbi:IS3 family transposase [Streptomyces sp. NPDC058316]|uniref:IS3 family transposase n=1 Tax=unclassified Streptomyces TaxID=2593676 RepID=UPI0036E1D541